MTYRSIVCMYVCITIIDTIIHHIHTNDANTYDTHTPQVYSAGLRLLPHLTLTLIHTHTHIHIHTYTHIHIHTYTHTHIHTYTHIHIHIHIHIHRSIVLAFVSSLTNLRRFSKWLVRIDCIKHTLSCVCMCMYVYVCVGLLPH
jgi:hypothetical protein